MSTGWSPSTILAAATLVYLMLVSRDLAVAGVPLKVLLLAASLASWYWKEGRQWRVLRFPLAMPVLVVGIVVPTVWVLLAFALGSLSPEAAKVAPHDALEEASRFPYLLLYFPLADLLDRPSRQLVWLVPGLVLAATTWILWLVLRFGAPSWENTTSVFTFGGIFGVQDGVTRVFFGNQIFLVPAVSLTVASFLAGTQKIRWALPIVALLGSAIYLAHTRGLWLAVMAAVVVTLALSAGRVIRFLARFAVPIVVVVGLAALVASVLFLSESNAGGVLTDASSAQRTHQASHLITAWEASPFLGNGIGAALADGYVRSVSAPWSFELTYLQLLSQIGIVGLALLMWPFMAAVIRGLKSAAGPRGVIVVTGVAGLTGLAVASATNPYLISSFGMTMTALGVALAAGRPAPEPVP